MIGFVLSILLTQGEAVRSQVAPSHMVSTHTTHVNPEEYQGPLACFEDEKRVMVGDIPTCVPIDKD